MQTVSHDDTVELILNALQKRWPNNYQSIIPYIEHLTKNGPACDPFTLLIGPVQSGKFLTINILMWIMVIKHGYHVSYVTKRLDIVRKDVLSKINKGLVKDLIDECCTNAGLTDEETRKYHIHTISGLHVVRSEQCTIPIFLMEDRNYANMISHLNRISHEKTLVIVDEVHEMYTDTSFNILNGGIEPGTTITNRHALHKLYDMCSSLPMFSMLGVTATPERVLVKDPICCVNKIFYLQPDAPVKGFEYYGYNQSELQNIEVFEHDGSYSDTVSKILDRKRNLLSETVAECKVIYICTCTYASDQEQIYAELMKKFGDRIHCKLLISDDTRRDNNIPKECVATSLTDFFDGRNLTDKICQTGALIVIARKTLAASATVKPDIGTECARTIDGIKYITCGITDQITNIASSIEDHMQKSRLFGWYPSGHKSTYWTPKSYFSDMLYGVNATHWSIINAYQLSTRLDSITTIKSSMTKVPKICAGKCPYKKVDQDISTFLSTTRPTFGRQINVDDTPDPSDGPVWTECNEQFVIYTITQVLRHQEVERFQTWMPNAVHIKTLQNMDTPPTETKKIRFYHWFGKVCSKHLVVNRAINYSTWQATLYRKVDASLKKSGSLIADDNKMLDADKMRKIETLLSPFIQLNKTPRRIVGLIRRQ
jgi:hypothetical protein